LRALVTAADCFFGSWLIESLVAGGVEVVGTVRKDGNGGSRRLLDIRDREAVEALVRDVAPDVIYHLAAQSNVTESVHDPLTTMTTNVIGSTNVFEAVRAVGRGRVVSVGSSAEYGDAAKPAGELRENDPLLPRSPYGVSKAAQGQLARVYARAHGVEVVHVRPFAIIGPRKRKDAISDFCINVVKLERGEATQFSIGNVSAVRDFVDIRDAVRALRMIGERGTRGEIYNICHGIGMPLSIVIDLLRATSKVPFTPTPDPARNRPVDDMRLVGDPYKLKALGFVPQFTLAQTLAFTLDYWRGQ